MRRTLNAMPSDERSICRACGKPIEEHAARYRTPAGDTHVHCHKEPRVLVVEDDSAFREFIVGMVKRIGYIADEAANGQEAIERFPRSSYDVILCALRMPAMNGPTFYREIQSRYPEAGFGENVVDHAGARRAVNGSAGMIAGGPESSAFPLSEAPGERRGRGQAAHRCPVVWRGRQPRSSEGTPIRWGCRRTRS
jgi:CheY-like chemotaxis protein